MPELPEVENYARFFAAHGLNRTIARVEVRDERILDLVRKETFARKLKGRRFRGVRRHGKHLFADAEGIWLHLHFGMSGDLTAYREGEDVPRFARVVFHFAEGEKLAFEDMRLFGVAGLLDSPDAFIAERGLGPDPLDPSFTYAKFAKLLERRKGAIKSLLMTQELLAGMGNLYADETLYQTSIAPRRPVDRLREPERRAIFTTMRRILRDSIRRNERGTAWPARYLTSHREEGDRCPRCGGAIRKTVVFGRTTYYCGTHQK
jgi:formamidopyrimidine-DNA glycosylase